MTTTYMRNSTRWTRQRATQDEAPAFALDVVVPHALVAKAMEQKGFSISRMRDIWKLRPIFDRASEEMMGTIHSITNRIQRTAVVFIRKELEAYGGVGCGTSGGFGPTLEKDFDRALRGSYEVNLNITDSKGHPGLANHMMALVEEAGLPVQVQQGTTNAVAKKIDDPFLVQRLAPLRDGLNKAVYKELKLPMPQGPVARHVLLLKLGR